MKKFKNAQFWLVSRVDGELQRHRLNVGRIAYGVAGGITTLVLIAFLAGIDYGKGVSWVQTQFSGQQIVETEEARVKRLKLVKRARELHNKEAELKKFNRELVQRLNELNGLLKKASDFGVVREAEFKRLSLRQNEIAKFAEEHTLDHNILDILSDYSDTIKFIPLGSPVANGRISSGYGYRNSPVSGHRKLHTGIDFAAPYGSKVTATAYGVVKAVKKISGYGLTVDVVHGTGVVTRYAHLATTTVQTGQKVMRGEVLGLVGMSGRSTGPHVHYELIVSGKAKSPHSLVEIFDRFKPEVLLASLPLA